MILKCPGSGKVEARLAAVSAVLQAAAAGVAAQGTAPAASGSGAATQMFYSPQAGPVIGISALAAPRQTQVKIKVGRGGEPMEKVCKHVGSKSNLMRRLNIFVLVARYLNIDYRKLTTLKMGYFHSLGPLAPQCKPQWPPWVVFML